jgi:hypothetical protein
MKSDSKIFKGMAWLLFLFIFFYLFIRVFFNEWMADEIYTFHYYIYFARYFGSSLVWDANNHLLNSVICHFLSPLIKYNLPLYRLPNLGAFVLYFFGIVQLTKGYKSPALRIIALLTFCSIPFIIENFAFCRGYGLSIGLFIWFLVFFLRYLSSAKLSHLIFAFLFLWLTISANLTFMSVGFLAIGYGMILHLTSLRNATKSKAFQCLLIDFLFSLALLPLVIFSFQLKKHGALYIGGEEGLWDHTGIRIVHSIFYSYDPRFLYLLIFIFAVLILECCRRFFHQSPLENAKNPLVLYCFLFFGSLLVIEAMYRLLGVNYPPERSAYGIVILFLVAVLEYVNQLKWGKYIPYLFLVFPLLFCFHISIRSSNLLLGDRMSYDFYKKVKKYIRPEHTLMHYPLMRWNWMRFEALEKNKSSAATYYHPFAHTTDVLLVKGTGWKDSAVCKMYDTLAYDRSTDFLALKRRIPLRKVLKFSSPQPVSLSATQKEFINLLSYDSLQRFMGKNIQLSVGGHIKSFREKNELILVLQTLDSMGGAGQHHLYEFHSMFRYEALNNSFQLNFALEQIAPEAKALVYIWNQGKEKVKLSDFTLTIYELQNEK